MLNALGYSDLQEFIADVVPADILDPKPPVEALPEGCGEAEAFQQLKQLSETNTLRRSLIGLGYYGTCLLYTSPSPRDKRQSRMPSSA